MPVDMNQTIQEASLDNLHDIIVPEAIGFFPLAPGWVIVGILLVALLFHWSIQFYRAYKKSLYKREALQEFDTLSEASRENILKLLDLAKRVAIAAYGRENVAQFSGERWWHFMEEHSKVHVSSELRSEIDTLLYNESALLNHNFEKIRSMVSVWIKTHKGTSDV
jgi:uncharacterized membrane protein